MNHEVDVVVLGLGTSGEDLALQLLDAGLEVAGVEAQLLGGECPLLGVYSLEGDDQGGEPSPRGAPRQWSSRDYRGDSRLVTRCSQDP